MMLSIQKIRLTATFSHQIFRSLDKVSRTESHEISKTQPSIRDQEMIQHSSLWGHQFVQGGAGEGDQRLKPDGSLGNIQVIKTDRGLPAYCDPPNPCPIGYSSDEFDCLEEFENSASFSREYQSSQECMCDQEHMFDCPMRGGASERDAESQLDTLARSIANNGDLSALIGNEKRVLIGDAKFGDAKFGDAKFGDAKFGDAKFGDADHRVVAKKYFSEDEHQQHLAELKGKTAHAWRSKVKRTESVDEKSYPWLNGEMTPQVMAKKSPEFYEH